MDWRAKALRRWSVSQSSDKERREIVAGVWYVYFLRLRNGDVYVGSTSDLRGRVASHERGQVASTKGYLPATLKSYVAIQAEGTERELERYFKSGSGKAFANKRLW